MSKQLKTKWIEDNAINGAKIRLANDEVLKARNAGDDADVNILKVSGDDSIQMAEFFKTPSSDPVTSYDVANKIWVENRKISDINDVNISSPAVGQALVWNGTNWVNSTVSGGGGAISELNDIGDVTITSVISGEILTYNGTNWANKPSVGEANFQTTFSFHLPAKATISERCMSALNVPEGWVVMAGISDQGLVHRLNNNATDLIVSHNIGHFACDVQVMEVDFTGPLTTQYASFVPLRTAQDVVRNNISDVGSGPTGVTGAFRIMDLAANLQTGNDAIVICSFLKPRS